MKGSRRAQLLSYCLALWHRGYFKFERVVSL
jgi:hypothetical protein